MNLTRRAYLYLSLVILGAGYLAGETAVVLPRLMVEMALSPSRASLLVSIRFAGGILTGIAMFLIGDRYSFRRIFAFSSILVVVSAILLPLAESFPLVLAVSALRGPTLTMYIVTANGALASWFRRHPGAWASRVHSLFGIGLILSPIVAFLAARLSLDWRVVWEFPGVLVVPLIALAGRIPEGRKQRGRTEPEVPERRADDQPLPATTWLLVILFAGITVGTEAVIIGWTPSYAALVGSGRLPSEAFGLFVAFGIFLGRRITSRVTVSVGPYRAHTLAIAFVGTLGLIMAFVPFARFPAATLLGFAMSAMYPLLIARIGAFAGRSGGKLYPVVELAASAGGTIIPAAVGVASERWHVTAYPLFLTGAAVGLVFLSRWLSDVIVRSRSR